MVTSSSSSSRRSSGPVLRSLSPSGRFYSPNTNSSLSAASSAFASSSASSFSSTSTTAFFNHHHSHYYNHDNYHQQHHSHHRSASPTRVNLYTSSPITPSFRFSINRSTSPNRSIAVSKQSNGPIKKTCMCSPTNHPGSFRCSLHKNSSVNNHHHHGSGGSGASLNRLNMRRSAMTNSLVRIGGVEGDWVKRALTALIRPSSHQQRRRAGFQSRPSRLSVMSRAEDL